MYAAKLIIFGIKIYRATLSKLLVLILGNGCRFYPTCSVYTQEAITQHGVVKGAILSLRRIGKCHPYSKQSYIDLVPKNF